MDYSQFLDRKLHNTADCGFDPVWMPGFLFGFQSELVQWATRLGRSAIFADCGMGKTPMQLVWAENVCRKTGGNVLIVTPLAVGHQTVKEGAKFGIECHRSQSGAVGGRITVTNYERLHLFNSDDFVGVVADESSILKNFDGVRRGMVTDFMRKRPYRLLCTATAAPNDYVELGTSAEALGVMGHMDMLTRFFRNMQNTIAPVRRWTAQQTGWAPLTAGGGRGVWRFKRHAERPFWRWICSWARALRRPSDLGFDDDGFILPDLVERETLVTNTAPPPGELFARPAVGLQEEREELRRTLRQRCEMVAEKVDHDRPAVVWCHLNPEGDLLEKLIPGSVQVSGSDSDEKKEESFLAFSAGDVRVLITKPKIGAFGLNWQHCSHMTFFPSHSYEQYYQGVRRCWRFGQTLPVVVDIITTEGGIGVLENLQRKSAQADRMFSELVVHMNDELRFKHQSNYEAKERLPAWL